MTRNTMIYMGKKTRIEPSLKSKCCAKPPWISRSGGEPPPRMLCQKPGGHRGKHQNGQDHQWEQGIKRPNREYRK